MIKVAEQCLGAKEKRRVVRHRLQKALMERNKAKIEVDGNKEHKKT